ncbi:hypothetical protein NDU88_001630 [Pleurodeles waltl]|uniref:Uncharacterized protein n=1 Tax=Pleurodeles waltl TaxID=8319 RepID=A0AAV7UTD6_PLEWA|nr:hypothetical protein NDU88_001630 [Pleurodeles waltl]
MATSVRQTVGRRTIKQTKEEAKPPLTALDTEAKGVGELAQPCLVHPPTGSGWPALGLVFARARPALQGARMSFEDMPPGTKEVLAAFLPQAQVENEVRSARCSLYLFCPQPIMQTSPRIPMQPDKLTVHRTPLPAC